MREVKPVVNRYLSIPLPLAEWLRAEAERRDTTITRVVLDLIEAAKRRDEEARGA